MSPSAPLPLKGITVVSIEQAVAAPFATRQLADLGARVINIERPGAVDFARSYDTSVRGMSSHFVWLNRTKESVTLDLKRPAAKFSRRLDRSKHFGLWPGFKALSRRWGQSPKSESTPKPYWLSLATREKRLRDGSKWA